MPEYYALRAREGDSVMTKEPGKLAFVDKTVEKTFGRYLVVGSNGKRFAECDAEDEAYMLEENINSAALSWAGERERLLVEALEAIIKHMEIVACPQFVGNSVVYSIAKKALESHRPPSTGEDRCSKCGQTDIGQYGEYPCEKCGLPTLFDNIKPPSDGEGKEEGL
jgi:hypothetical protein